MSFEMFAGDTMRVYFAIKDKDGGSLDITGAEVRWQISRLKPTGFSNTPLLNKRIGDGIEVVDSFDGQLLVRLAPEDTVSLSGSFHAELELQDVDGDVSTAYTGTVTIKKALIRPPA